MMSSQCFQGKSFGPCEDSNEEECGGEHAAEYVYELKTATGKGKKSLLIFFKNFFSSENITVTRLAAVQKVSENNRK